MIILRTLCRFEVHREDQPTIHFFEHLTFLKKNRSKVANRSVGYFCKVIT
jgi:hypothetical protein